MPEEVPLHELESLGSDISDAHTLSTFFEPTSDIQQTGTLDHAKVFVPLAPATTLVDLVERSRFPGRDITFQITNVSSHAVAYGGPSDVYKGTWHRGDGIRSAVAIKTLRIAGHPSRRVMRKLRDEVTVWEQLHHPNVQPLCGLHWNMGEIPAMVSPWREYGDINSYIRLHPWRDRSVTDVKTHLLLQVLDGLHYLHTHTPVIVHGDIKGANVLVSDEGVALICDFGIASVLAEESRSSSSASVSAIKGTCRWMSPELYATDDARHTIWSDIWATGCLILEVMGGLPPYFDKRHDQQVIIALSRCELPARPPNLAEPSWQLVLHCCRIDAVSRPPMQEIRKRMKVLRDRLLQAELFPGQHLHVELPAGGNTTRTRTIQDETDLNREIDITITLRDRLPKPEKSGSIWSNCPRVPDGIVLVLGLLSFLGIMFVMARFIPWTSDQPASPSPV